MADQDTLEVDEYMVAAHTRVEEIVTKDEKEYFKEIHSVRARHQDKIKGQCQ